MLILANKRITVDLFMPCMFNMMMLCFQDSLKVQTQELVGRDNTVSVNVIRREGFYGRVTVRWVTTGEHDGTNDITPLEGIVSHLLMDNCKILSLSAHLISYTYLR